MKLFKHRAEKYGLYGALFGLFFPIFATVVECQKYFTDWGLEQAWMVQQQSELLWIIDMIPFLLGLFAYMIGHHADTLGTISSELLRAQAQLISQEKMATVGKLTAGIAHEIKNPLNFVTNFSESSSEIADDLLSLISRSREQFAPDTLQRICELIAVLKQNALDVHSNGLRANRIVHALMDHTRGNKVKKVKASINDLVETNVHLADQGYRANHPTFNVRTRRNYATDLREARINPHSFGRVILNLLNNAYYALDQKQLKLGKHFDPILDISTIQESDNIIIRIRDNGIGIPEHIQNNIFKPFFTTKPIGQANSGLGLSISKDIVLQEHGGTIDIESAVGEFTQFTIRIPIMQSAPPSGQKHQETYQDGRGANQLSNQASASTKF